MAIFNINADFGRVAKALERIVLLLENLVLIQVDSSFRAHVARNGIAPIEGKPVGRPADESKFSQPSDEDLWERELEDDIRREQGLPTEKTPASNRKETNEPNYDRPIRYEPWFSNRA